MIPQSYYTKLSDYYGDTMKAWDWFIKPHPGLGEQKPLDVIRKGHGSQVMALIDNMCGDVHALK